MIRVCPESDNECRFGMGCKKPCAGNIFRPIAAPVMRPAQAGMIRAAAGILRELYDDGYIDWSVSGQPTLERLAEQLEGFVQTYNNVEKST